MFQHHLVLQQSASDEAPHVLHQSVDLEITEVGHSLDTSHQKVKDSGPETGIEFG